MPSGSHSGSGGSHFGGGSSSGSHFGGGSRLGGGSVNARPIIFIHHGRRYSVRGGAQSAVSLMFVLCIFAIFTIFFGVIMIPTANSQIKKIEADYTYYQAMIDYAEEHNAYLVTGKVTGKFYNEDCDKWYITYSIEIDEYTDLEGYTFSVYTFDEVSRFEINEYIAIAVDSVPITLDTDSIPMDYKDMPLTRDGEYVDAKQDKTAGVIVIVVASIVLVGLISGIVVIIIKKKQLVTDTNPTTNTSTNTAKEPTRCSYCGAILGENDKSCPTCGAKR